MITVPVWPNSSSGFLFLKRKCTKINVHLVLPIYMIFFVSLPLMNYHCFDTIINGIQPHSSLKYQHWYQS